MNIFSQHFQQSFFHGNCGSTPIFIRTFIENESYQKHIISLFRKKKNSSSSQNLIHLYQDFYQLSEIVWTYQHHY